MDEIFELLKQGKLDELTRIFDIEGVCNEIEYTVPPDVYWGLQDSLKVLPFIVSLYTFGTKKSISFTYNGRDYKINKAPITQPV